MEETAATLNSARALREAYGVNTTRGVFANSLPISNKAAIKTNVI